MMMKMNDNKQLNWYNSILNTISDVASKFIRAFKKNGFIFSFATMMVFILIYCTIINPINVGKIVERKLLTEKEKSIEANELAMQRRLEADEIVGDIMTKIVDKFESVHRVMMLEAHNSLQSLQGIDFLYYSCTSEMLTPNSRNFNYLSDDIQRSMRANLIGNNMLQILKHRDYILYDNIAECNHPQHRLIHKLADAGDSQAILIPFLNNKKDPVILLVISGDNLPTNEIIEYVNEHKKSIEQCLM